MVGATLANCWLVALPRWPTDKNARPAVPLANKGPTVMQPIFRWSDSLQINEGFCH